MLVFAPALVCLPTYLEKLPLLPLLATLSHHSRLGLAVRLPLRRLGCLQSQSLSLSTLLKPRGSQRTADGSDTGRKGRRRSASFRRNQPKDKFKTATKPFFVQHSSRFKLCSMKHEIQPKPQFLIFFTFFFFVTIKYQRHK